MSAGYTQTPERISKPVFTDDPNILRIDKPASLTQPDITYHPDREKWSRRSAQRLADNPSLPSTPLPDGFPQKLVSPLVWEGNDWKDESQWVFNLTLEHLREIDAAVKHFHGLGLKFGHISPETFPLPTLGPELKGLAREVYYGRGFFVLRALPVDSYSNSDNVLVYVGVSSYIAGTRGLQDKNGGVLSHIKDLSQTHTKEAIGGPAYTKDKQVFHTDPGCDVVSLFALQTAAEGGVSRISSSWRVYNELAERRPDLIKTLSEPWVFDEFGRDPPFTSRPILHYLDGRAMIQYARRYFTGYQGLPRSTNIAPITEAQAEALDALHFLGERFSLGLNFQKGDIQFINNLSVFHARDGFKNTEEKSRHLLRLWLRNEELGWKLPESLKLLWNKTFNVTPEEQTFAIDPVIRDAGFDGDFPVPENTECPRGRCHTPRLAVYPHSFSQTTMSFFGGATNVKISGTPTFTVINGNVTTFDQSRHTTNHDSFNTRTTNTIGSHNDQSSRYRGVNGLPAQAARGYQQAPYGQQQHPQLSQGYPQYPAYGQAPAAYPPYGAPAQYPPNPYPSPPPPASRVENHNSFNTRNKNIQDSYNDQSVRINEDDEDSPPHRKKGKKKKIPLPPPESNSEDDDSEEEEEEQPPKPVKRGSDRKGKSKDDRGDQGGSKFQRNKPAPPRAASPPETSRYRPQETGLHGVHGLAGLGRGVSHSQVVDAQIQHMSPDMAKQFSQLMKTVEKETAFSDSEEEVENTEEEESSDEEEEVVPPVKAKEPVKGKDRVKRDASSKWPQAADSQAQGGSKYSPTAARTSKRDSVDDMGPKVDPKDSPRPAFSRNKSDPQLAASLAVPNRMGSLRAESTPDIPEHLKVASEVTNENNEDEAADPTTTGGDILAAQELSESSRPAFSHVKSDPQAPQQTIPPIVSISPPAAPVHANTTPNIPEHLKQYGSGPEFGFAPPEQSRSASHPPPNSPPKVQSGGRSPDNDAHSTGNLQSPKSKHRFIGKIKKILK